MKIHTKAVHSGDRKRAGGHVPVTTPIHTATSYFYESMAQLDRVFGDAEKGYCYARYDNPSTAALVGLAEAAVHVARTSTRRMDKVLFNLASLPLAIGVAGCTGMCTGTHLHFEMRVNGVAVDPRYFLR